MNEHWTFKQELAQVKSELVKLVGCTVYTIDKRRPNYIAEVNRGGFIVKSLSGQVQARWEDIERGYDFLYEDGVLRTNYWYTQNGVWSTGISGDSFCRAILSTLANVVIARDEEGFYLEYIPDLPIQLVEDRYSEGDAR